MKKTIKFNELLEFIAEHENFAETLSEFTGMNKEGIRDLLLKHGKNLENPDIEVIIDERMGEQAETSLPTGYTIYVDGASRGNPGPSGIGIVIFSGKDEVMKISEYIGDGTNNRAEYEALIRALKEATKLQYFSVRIYSDSELMVKQIKGEYRVLDSDLEKLYKKAFKEIHKFSQFEIVYLGRRQNKIADQLANEAIDKALKK